MVAWPPLWGVQLGGAAAVGAGTFVGAATAGGGVAWTGTIGATVAGGPLLVGAVGVARHAMSNPSPPAPPRPTRNLRRDSSVPDICPTPCLFTVSCGSPGADRARGAGRPPQN